MFKDVVEVISIVPTIDAETGDPNYQVQFGHMVKLTEETRRTIPRAPGSVPPKVQPTVVFGIFMDANGVVPYKVGSKWELVVDDNGKMTLKEAKP